MKTEITEIGTVRVSTGESTWTCNAPDQAAKHIATWTDGKRDGRPSEVIEPGDVSAIRDCHADAQRQLASTGRYRPTASWVYRNDGTVTQTVGAQLDADTINATAVADAAVAPDAAEVAAAPSLLGKLARFFGLTK